MAFFRSYIYLFFLCIGSLGKAQSNVFKNLLQNNGLPSNDCYKIHQDAKGYIWVATEKGICKYNGQYFTNYNISKGLPNNVCLFIFEDKHQNIYPITYQGGVGVIYNNTLSDVQNTVKDLKLKYETEFNNYLFCAYQDTAENIFIGGSNVLFELKKNKQIIRFDFVHTDYVTISKLFSYKKTLYAITEKGISNLQSKQIVFPIDMSSHYIPRYCTYKDTMFFVYDNTIYKVKDLSIQLIKHISLPSHITSFRFFNDSTLLLGSNSGLYKYQLNTEAIYDYEDLKNKYVTDVLIDNEQNIWASTLGNGIYSANNVQLNQINQLYNQSITSLFCDSNYLCVGTNNGSCYYRNLTQNSTAYTKVDLNDISNNFIKSIKQHAIHNHNIYIAYGDKIVIYNIKTRTYETQKTSSIKSIAKTQNNQLFATTVSGLIHLNLLAKNNSFTFQTLPVELVHNNIYSIEYDSIENGYLLGKINKIEKYKNDKLQSIPIKGRIDKIQTKNQKLFWFLNNDIGIQIYDRNKIITLLKNDTENYNDFYLENDSVAWVGGSSGLTKLDINTKALTIKHKTIYQLSNVDLDFNIKQLILIKNTFLFGTTNGLFEIDKKDLSCTNYNIPIYASNVMVNGEAQLIDSVYNLKDFQTNISIQFNGLYFQNPNKIHYRYKLLPIDTAWQYTAINKLDFPNLTSGNYTLIINACDKYNYWSSSYLSLKINIALPFYKTWWFLTLVYVLFALCIGLIFYYIYYKNNKKREYEYELKNKIIRAEEIAFTSQLNPHFIFNAINSIQRYILKSKPEEAFNHLSKFSNLMRGILVNSKSETVSLISDIENLKLYMELEKLRFNNKLNYSIVTHFEPDANLKIPPMLIQPYIENAIWHGIMSKTEGGNVTIDYYLENGKLLVTIKDDGIGRIASKKITSVKQGTGSGMVISQNRLKLFSEKRNASYAIEITDLYKDEIPAGTLVKLFIPI